MSRRNGLTRTPPKNMFRLHNVMRTYRSRSGRTHAKTRARARSARFVALWTTASIMLSYY